MSDSLNNYRVLCKAISLLLPNQLEVVIHDLGSGKIAHIENPYSNRTVGDDSLIDEDELTTEIDNKAIIGPYSKSTPEGESTKSITSVLRDDEGVATHLLCINMKTGLLAQSAKLLASLIDIESEQQSPALMGSDWRENANQIIAKTLSELGMAMHATSKADKLKIVATLEANQIFQVRGSSDYVAKAFGISRASLYTLLRDVRQH